MAVITFVRKFSIDHEDNGKKTRCKVLLILQDDQSGVEYLVETPDHEKLWVDDEKVSSLYSDDPD